MNAEEVQPVRHRAIDVPRLRDRLVAAWRGGVLEELLAMEDAPTYFPVRPHPDGGWSQWSIREWVDHLIPLAGREDLPLYFVDADMTADVREAAEARPYYQVHADQLPTPTGMVVFGDTVCDVPKERLLPGQRVLVNAAIWFPIEETGSGPGVMVVSLQDTRVLMATQPLDAQHRAMFESILEEMRLRFGPLAYHDETPMPFGENPWGEQRPRVNNTLAAAMLTTWMFMRQALTTIREERLPGPVRRRYVREGRPVPTVRTVTMRRNAPGYVPGTDVQVQRPGEPDRTYSKRWTVRGYGYWRNTWYPSRQRHELQWVEVPEYVKGPKDAPLIGTPRVDVLRKR